MDPANQKPKSRSGSTQNERANILQNIDQSIEDPTHHPCISGIKEHTFLWRPQLHNFIPEDEYRVVLD